MNRAKRLMVVAIGFAAVAAMLAASVVSVAAPASSPQVQQFKKAVAALMKQPTSLVVPPLPKKPATGKTLDFVVCATPTCHGFTSYLKAATAAVGWKLNAVEGGFAPTEIANAWNQVLRDKPDGVIASGGIPAALFATQLKQLKAEGIPVVLHDQSPETTPGVTAVVLSNKENAQFGRELAQLIVADANGKNAHVAMFVTPQVPVFANEDNAIKNIIQSSACKGCSVGTSSFPVSAAGTTLPSQVVSYLRANPKINYAYFDFNDAVDGVPAALARAGLAKKVKIVSNNLGTTEAAYIRAGTMWAAAANPWPEVLWKDFDIVLASVQKAPLAPAVGLNLPNMIITKQNVPAVIKQGSFPLVLNYAKVFKKAWHVK